MTNQGRRFIGLDIPHDMAHLHVSGETVFVDDMPVCNDALQIYVVGSSIAAGSLTRLDLKKVRDHKDVVCVLDAGDIPGVNKIGDLASDEPVFADRKILYSGQPLFAVVADSIEQAKSAAKLAGIKYDRAEPVVTIDQALKARSRFSSDMVIKRGRSAAAIKNSDQKLSGSFTIGGQAHFYLEGQICVAVPQSLNQLQVYCSTENIFRVKQAIEKSVKTEDVTVNSLRPGGAFGGKETQAVRWAIIAALVAQKTGKPALMKLDRLNDMIMTGKGYDYKVDYNVGFNQAGLIQGIEITLACRCGCSSEFSELVNNQAALHADNAYYLKNVTIITRRLKTHTVSGTSFTGSGSAQGMIAIEHIIDAIAARLGLDSFKVRLANLYGNSTGRITHYGMRVDDDSLSLMIDELKRTSTYLKRRKAVTEFNRSSPIIKRGIALVPVKFGVSTGLLNHSVQSHAFVNLEKNGSILVRISGVEMGQGLSVKVAQIVAEVFQVDPKLIKICPANTDDISEISTLTHSSSIKTNGKAAQQAAEKLKKQLLEFSTGEYGQPKTRINFTAEGVKIDKKTVQFKTLVSQALSKGLSLSACGFYCDKETHFDSKKGKGHPFNYFVNGAAVSEVAIDTLTGESQVLRVDILQDCGQSINPAIDLGQIEGGFMQGMGWVTMEELTWSSDGHLQTNTSASYKIPVCSDMPGEFNVRMWKKGKVAEHAIFNSKLVGESPLMLAISVYSALTHAIASIKADDRELPVIDIPVTPERILMAISN